LGALGIVKRVFSSVGLDRYLDRVEVGGSNLSTLTRLDVNVEPFLMPYFELFSNFSAFLRISTPYFPELNEEDMSMI
tara:strand:+ start:254 stop:484 length:231 start_codon:yes stop_codon:yes gene_type:complete